MALKKALCRVHRHYVCLVSCLRVSRSKYLRSILCSRTVELYTPLLPEHNPRLFTTHRGRYAMNSGTAELESMLIA
jgi:hypothetical protein